MSKQRLEMTWIGINTRPKLEPDYSGKVKFIYIDPPYNIGGDCGFG